MCRPHLAVCALVRCSRIYPPRDAACWQRTLVRCLTATLRRNGSSVTTVPQRSSPNAPDPREQLSTEPLHPCWRSVQVSFISGHGRSRHPGLAVEVHCAVANTSAVVSKCPVDGQDASTNPPAPHWRPPANDDTKYQQIEAPNCNTISQLPSV